MIYLDHAAATFPYPDFLETGDLYANPSSVHQPGREVRAKLDQARMTISQILECQSSEVIFTSGATEAIHLAIIGHYLQLRSQKPEARSKGIIYTSSLVHSCVWSALEFLAKNFDVEMKHLPIDSQGFIDLEAIGESVFDEADMIISEFGNSEIGLLQPVTKLGKMIDKWASENKASKPTFIIDGAAAVVTEKIALEYQKCDMIALSGEKFGGLKGSGILVKKEGIPLQSIIGGSHELGYRGGTENVLGAVALGKALETHSKQRAELREQYVGFHDFVRKNLPACQITTPVENYLPHVFHFVLPSSTAAVFVAQADLAGLAISAGSACSSGTTTESKVLLNLGLDSENASRGVRLSFGRSTTQEELEKALEIIKQLLSS